MNEILKQFTPNNIADGSYERLSIVSLINNLDATKSVAQSAPANKVDLINPLPRVMFIVA